MTSVPHEKAVAPVLCLQKYQLHMLDVYDGFQHEQGCGRAQNVTGNASLEVQHQSFA